METYGHSRTVQASNPLERCHYVCERKVRVTTRVVLREDQVTGQTLDVNSEVW